LLIVLLSCQQRNETGDQGNIGFPDSLVSWTLGQEEQAYWDYYQRIEAEILKGGHARKEEIDDYLQVLIDEDLVHEPQIYMDTDSGTMFQTVDYKTYKKYRLEHPIDSNRGIIVVLPRLDTLLKDSLRRGIIKALGEDTLQ
jgi:hypothetical protein